LTRSARHPHLWIPDERLGADWAYALATINGLKV